MAQTQIIRRRIRSVSSTHQITKAMELVSASKLRRAQEASLRSRAYTDSAYTILRRLSQLTDAASHPLFLPHESERRLIILFTSDRGLAGAYNSNLFRALIDALQDSQGVRLIVIGNQGIRFASRFDGNDLVGAYGEWPSEPTSVDVRALVESAISMFTGGEVDIVDLIYTKFISSITQAVVREQLLPARLDDNAAEPQAPLEDTLFEPSPQAVLTAMMPRLIEAQVLAAALNATASEHSMRMMAMKSASDNASDIIDDLTLEYNSARQASITQELAEITGGAEAIA